MLSFELKGADIVLIGLRDAPLRLQQKVMHLLEGAAFAIQAKAQREVPVRVGRLKQSIQTVVKSRDPIHIEVGPHTEYAKWVEFGRGWVYPVNKKVLRWEERGRMEVFSRHARPAKAQPFMRPAIEAGFARLGLLLNQAMRESFGQ